MSSEGRRVHNEGGQQELMARKWEGKGTAKPGFVAGFSLLFLLQMRVLSWRFLCCNHVLQRLEIAGMR